MWRAGSRSTRRRSGVLEGSAWVGCGCTSVIRSPGRRGRSGGPDDPKEGNAGNGPRSWGKSQFVTLAVKTRPCLDVLAEGRRAPRRVQDVVAESERRRGQLSIHQELPALICEGLVPSDQPQGAKLHPVRRRRASPALLVERPGRLEDVLEHRQVDAALPRARRYVEAGVYARLPHLRSEALRVPVGDRRRDLVLELAERTLGQIDSARRGDAKRERR